MRTLFEIPLVLFVAAYAAGWLLVRRSAGVRWFAAADGAAAAAILLVVAALNVRTAGFFVSLGANVMSIAATHRNGGAMYHAVSGPQLYSLVYGPYTFLLYEPMLHFADALVAVKLELLVLDALTLLTMFQLLRRSGQASWQTALALTGVAAACLLAVPAGVLGVRGDLWVVFALTAGLLAVDTARGWIAAVAVGLACGFVMDVKATLCIVSLLLLTLLWRRHGLRSVSLATAIAATVAAAPFASAHISLRNYAAWLALSEHRQSFAGLALANVLFAVLLLLPAWLVWKSCHHEARHERHWPELALFCAALILVIVTGSKSGGGPWHLWPLLPFVLWWTARRLTQCEPLHAQRLASSLAFAALVVAGRWGLRAVRMELPQMSAGARATVNAEKAELLSLAENNSETAMQLAPGAHMSSDADDLRYYLVWAGEPYFIDQVAAGEALKTDPDLLPPLAGTVAGCGRWWVVPRGEVPFSTLNNNETQATYPQIFPSSVRAAFLQGHHLLKQGRYYDLWGTAQPHGSQSTPCE